MLPSDLDAQFGTPYPRSAGFDTDIGAFIESSSVSSPSGPMAPLIITNDEVQGATFLPGQIFVFGGFALRANSLGHLEQIESYAPGHQVRFGSLNYTANIRGDLIFDGFEPQPGALHYLEGHYIALPPNSVLEAAYAPAPILDSEPAAFVEDERLDVTSGAAISKAIEPNDSPALRVAHDSEEPGSSPSSETPSPLPIESGWAPVMEFTAADIFQHSPFSDILNSLESLSLSGEPRPNYGLRGWDSDDEEIQSPPTTHLIATVDDLTNMLDFGSEDFDGMDDEDGDELEPAPIGHWISTTPNDVFMVDTPERIGNEEKGCERKGKPSEKHSKRRRKRRAKPHLDQDPAVEQDDDERVSEQPSEQGNTGREDEQSSPGHNRITDDTTPDKIMEQKNLQERLVATARSLKKQKRKLKTAENALKTRWSKVIKTADKYGGSRRTKSYPKRKLLPEFDQEAIEPPNSKNKKATRSDRRPLGHYKTANGAALDAACDPVKDSHHGPARSIYGPKKQALANNAQNPPSESGTPRYRGAAHPLCFTDEVLEHEFPEGFKPVNIEAYDGTTDPGVWIEDYILHIHMARGDDLHAIKYLPLKLKGPARHWLKSLPENTIGSWEELEDAFRANFQGTYVRSPDADDLSHITQQPGESARKFWNRFLTKKNQIVDCPDAEALAAFKHNVRDEWLARHLGQEKPRTMATLTSLMTRFCAGEDSWLARCSTCDPSTSEIRDGNGKPRRSKDQRRNKGSSPKSTTVNAGFKSSRQNQKKPPP